MPINLKTLKSDYRKITSNILEEFDKECTIEVDCRLHGKFRHAPVKSLPEGDCPDCFFQDEILKCISAIDPDWIDKSELH